MRMNCGCFIVPGNVLDRLAKDESLPEATRKAFADTSAGEVIWRRLRDAHGVATKATLLSRGVASSLTPNPAVTVYHCNHSISLPGMPVLNPGTSADVTIKRAFDTTTKVVQFYQAAFGRNSVDNTGMTLISSVHYDVKYNNAFWDGAQMTYGDGDGNIFIDFTASNDVVAHELTHGVTQFTAGLNYTNEAGGLNESASDVFGTMFRQWVLQQTVATADWLIGADIMGPGAKARGFTCLRDLATPGADHCLSPQPSHYSSYVPGSDPHESSGIPNHAFYLAASALGGKTWEKLGPVWYMALTGGRPNPGMRFRTFANRTRRAAKKLYPTDTAVYSAVDQGWYGVGL